MKNEIRNEQIYLLATDDFIETLSEISSLLPEYKIENFLDAIFAIKQISPPEKTYYKIED